ncbi:MAG: hypothetical protein ACK4P1_08735 [Aggregatilineales bacterium]
MAWTNPKTWVAGDVVGANDLNEQLRDNLSYLHSRPHQRIVRVATADYITTSTTFVDIDSTNLSITLTVSSGAVMVGFSGVTLVNTGANVKPAFNFTIDSVPFTSAARGVVCYDQPAGAAVFDGPVSYVALVTDLTVGAHTFRPQWRNIATGTVMLYAVSSPVIFWAMEVA